MHPEELLEQDDFHVFLEGSQVDFVEKAGEKDPDRKRWIAGVCSTGNRDRQDEIVVQKGLDFSEFVKWGYYNDNHKQDTDAILGVPVEARLTDNGWFTKGYLLDTDRAKRIWEVAKALSQTEDRRYGFSIEGKVIERGDGGKILKARVRNVAITNSPVNPWCSWDVLTKAFAPTREMEAHHRDYKKAVSAGHGRPKVSGGRVLTTLEEVESEVSKGLLTFERAQLLTVNEALDTVARLRPQYSPETIKRIVSLAIKKEALR